MGSLNTMFLAKEMYLATCVSFTFALFFNEYSHETIVYFSFYLLELKNR